MSILLQQEKVASSETIDRYFKEVELKDETEYRNNIWQFLKRIFRLI